MRRLNDLPVAGRSLVIELRVRRLVCLSTECQQRTFRQQIPHGALRYARRTVRLTTTIGRPALTLAGRAGRGRAHAATAEQLQRPPRYGHTLIDSYRDHLRRRLAAGPDVAVTRLLAESRELGYRGSASLLVRCLNQGRANTERTTPPPRRLVLWIMTRPAYLPEHEHAHMQDLLDGCPHLTILTEHIRAFAQLLTRRRGVDLQNWMAAVEAAIFPCCTASSVACAKIYPPPPPPSPYGRTGFPLLQQRILLS